MEVVFNPLPHEQKAGTTSFLVWNNPDLERAMNVAFGVSSNERIDRIEITPQGIKAIFDKIKEATGSTWWLGIEEWANRTFAACIKADSTPGYQSKVTRELVPAYIGQLAKERDHANRMSNTAADMCQRAESQLATLRTACEAAKARFEVIKQMQDEFSARVLINCGCDENDEVLEQLTTALEGT